MVGSKELPSLRVQVVFHEKLCFGRAANDGLTQARGRGLEDRVTNLAPVLVTRDTLLNMSASALSTFVFYGPPSWHRPPRCLTTTFAPVARSNSSVVLLRVVLLRSEHTHRYIVACLYTG